MPLVHTGIGRGAISPSGRSVKLQSFVDLAYVTSLAGISEPHIFSDSTATRAMVSVVESVFVSDTLQVTSNFNNIDHIALSDHMGQLSTANVIELWAISDISSYDPNANNIDIVIESMFVSEISDRITEIFAIGDLASSTSSSRTDSIPFVDAENGSNKTTEVLPVTDNQTHP